MRTRATDLFFRDPEAIARLHKAASEWLGVSGDGVHADRPTPFRKFGRAKGPTGGVDCAALVEELQIESGVAKSGEFEFPRDDADYQSHRPEEKIRKYLDGLEKSGRLLGLKIPEFEGNPPDDFFIAGDIVLFREGRKRKPEQPGGLFHMAVMLDGRRFVNAVPFYGVVGGDLHDTSYAKHFIGGWRPLRK